jgi:uncharacterized damage-inducible protein DinB
LLNNLGYTTLLSNWEKGDVPVNITEFIGKSLAESNEYINQAIKGLSPDELSFRPQPHSNSIAFLLWHLARIEDIWINKILLGEKEMYESEGWYQKFGTPAQDSGFGYDVKKIDVWPVPTLVLLQAYATTVRGKTQVFLNSLNDQKLDESKDLGWRKGTIGSALSHLVMEVGEHTGQIGYIRGFMKGIESPTPPPRK